MSGKMYAVVIFGWIMSTWMQSVVSTDTQVTSDLNTVLSMEIITMRSWAAFSVPIPNLGYVAAIARMMSWNYPWFHGQMQIVRAIILLPLSGVLIWGLLTGVMPVLLSASQQVLSAGSNIVSGLLRGASGIIRGG